MDALKEAGQENLNSAVTPLVLESSPRRWQHFQIAAKEPCMLPSTALWCFEMLRAEW